MAAQLSLLAGDSGCRGGGRHSGGGRGSGRSAGGWVVAFWCGCLQLWFCLLLMPRWPAAVWRWRQRTTCWVPGVAGGKKRWQHRHAGPEGRHRLPCTCRHRLPCARPHCSLAHCTSHPLCSTSPHPARCTSHPAPALQSCRSRGTTRQARCSTEAASAALCARLFCSTAVLCGPAALCGCLGAALQCSTRPVLSCPAVGAAPRMHD